MHTLAIHQIEKAPLTSSAQPLEIKSTTSKTKRPPHVPAFVFASSLNLRWPAVGVLLFVAALTVTLGVILNSDVTNVWLPLYKSRSIMGTFAKAAIVAEAAPCAHVGREILWMGGSAVDAAIAVLFCTGVVMPQSMGLGGGFFMLVYKRSTNNVTFIDSREYAPLKATENMFHAKKIRAEKGPLSIAVPSELSGYAAAHKMFGKLDWKRIIHPTIRMCRKGIEVNKHLAKTIKQYEKELWPNKQFRDIFFNPKTGKPLKKGEKMYRPLLADTLEAIVKYKRKALYDPENKLGSKFLQDLIDLGTIITKKDLIKNNPRFTEPIRVQYENYTLYSNNLPGSGSVLAYMFNILEGYNMVPSMAYNRERISLFIHRMVEAMKFGYAKRMRLEDDLEGLKPFIDKMISKEGSISTRAKIHDDMTENNLEYYGYKNDTQLVEDSGTSHISILAPNGDAVAVTSTINYIFGSMNISKSTDIILNNQMNDFAIPGVTSLYGLPPSKYNRIRPLKKPLSSMCPTIVLDKKQNVRLILGASGGTRITTSMLQVAVWNLMFDLNIKQAIDAMRLHHQLFPNNVFVEEKYPKTLLKFLEDNGHKIKLVDNKKIPNSVTGISVNRYGVIQANADYRKGGGVDGY